MSRDIFTRKTKPKTVSFRAPEKTVERLDALRERIKRQGGDDLEFNFDAVMSAEVDRIVKAANKHLDELHRTPPVSDDPGAGTMSRETA